MTTAISEVEQRLAAVGVTIPDVVPPVAAYQPAVVEGNTIYVSGQLPLVGGKLPHTGKVGAEVTEEQAYELARFCGINLIAALKYALQDLDGGLDRVTRIAKVGGFVASTPDFTGQPRVINGTSEILAEAFGDIGQHARSAVGVNVLPLDTPVEVDLIAYFA